MRGPLAAGVSKLPLQGRGDLFQGRACGVGRYLLMPPQPRPHCPGRGERQAAVQEGAARTFC